MVESAFRISQHVLSFCRYQKSEWISEGGDGNIFENVCVVSPYN